MKTHRLFVEKHPAFRVEAHSLKEDLNAHLGLNLKELRLINVYDLFGFSEELVEKSRYGVFGEIVTDHVTSEPPAAPEMLAIELVPGQFDQRAASAEDCVRLLDPAAKISIRSGKILLFDRKLTDPEREKIKKYCINAVEAREKELSVLAQTPQPEAAPTPVLTDFRQMEEADLDPYVQANGLAMNADDLREVVRYFRAEGRDPRLTELKILDTYWSDHCRHTTFMTELEDITIEESFLHDELEGTLELYLRLRRELGREDKGICLMDMATIGAKYLRKQGLLNDLEVSEENNACSIYIEVDVDGAPERWLLQFKNETHNHPTEIEPFGGASTCLGGAIRDPLSGRAYVYQAMRVTGAGDIWAPVDRTLAGKLPQRVISTQAAAGYSSYGNQIGLATGHVREIYHPDYVAKRMEVGAVVGAVRAADVRRESPAAGDMVLLLGGRTGRDGVGGATGSSKEHDEQSLEVCGSEVQKGNAPEERKLQRFMRRAEATRLIKKANDFGAGGVSVAIGELADGLEIYLDRVPTKYSGLSATELAISESQERMAVVVSPDQAAELTRYAEQENIEVTHVADVTDAARMRMHWHGEIVVDLSRAFIDSAGAAHFAKATVAAVEERDPLARVVKGANLRERVLSNLQDPNVLSQRSMGEMFDSTIGRSTVLMPYGGLTQRTETQVSVQKIPVRKGVTTTASAMAWGYNPAIASWSPYHGAAYAVVEAAARVVACGARYERMRYSYQEYFERMTKSPLTWGRPLAALLGALKMQVELGLPSIGGKDSMSGSFQHINVPPMLMAFGITTIRASAVISPEFKAAGHKLYLIKHTPTETHMPDAEQLARNFRTVSEAIARGTVVAAWAVGEGGVAEAVAKMSFGNEIGAAIELPETALFERSIGSILVEATDEMDAELIGHTTAERALVINGERFSLDELYRANTERYEQIYPLKAATTPPVMIAGAVRAVENPTAKWSHAPVEKPIVLLPLFPGTNCDYDTAKAFERAGGEVRMELFRNLTPEATADSIVRLAEQIDQCHILALSGGFSAGDEPDGSGKFIVSVLNNATIAAAVHRLRDRGGLILGICNGFQALVKSGLLPYGRLGMVTRDSPTLFRNDLNRHISLIATTRVCNARSPWLRGLKPGDLHAIAMSHGEGKFVCSQAEAERLFSRGQVAFCYAGDNPNGSYYDIEGITSEDGRILGKMGHTERYEDGLYRNIAGEKRQPLFENAIQYFQ